MPSARPQPPPDQAAISTALAGMLGLVGFLTLLVIGLALGAGIWLDGRFNSKPVFTIALLLGSIPVTLVMMVRVLTGGMARFRKPQGGSPTPAGHGEDDDNSGS